MEPQPADGGILVIDDDFVVRRVVAETLLDEGYRVACAADGREALDQLHQAQDCLPAVILLDLKMPGMNGHEFLDELQKHEQLATIPVVVLSASRYDVRRAGGNVVRHLPKPMTRDSLLSAIGAHFSRC